MLKTRAGIQQLSTALSVLGTVCIALSAIGTMTISIEGINHTLKLSWMQFLAIPILILSVLLMFLSFRHRFDNAGLPAGSADDAITELSTKNTLRYWLGWYNVDGNITICTKDLDWIMGKRRGKQPLVELLEGKSRRGEITLWLSREHIDDQITKKLSKAGARIKTLPDFAVADDRLVFSLREVQGFKECVLRHSLEDGREPNTIKVHTVNSSVYIALIEAYCKALESSK
jgi:hypothetical protein